MARQARALRQSTLWGAPEVVQVQVRKSARVARRSACASAEHMREHSTLASPPRKRTWRPPTPPRSISDHIERKRVLSVTDLVSPSWCEYAYLYNILAQSHLPLLQRPTSITTPQGNVLTPSWAQLVARDEILAQGVKVHEAIEREVQPVELTFRFVAPADRWALLLLQFAAGIHAARTTGRAREVPVLGYVHGRLVRGIIDELRREGPAVLVSDTKTRRSLRLPPELDQLQARLQVMLYKRLVDSLYAGITGTAVDTDDVYDEPVSIPAVCDTLQLDLEAPLSDELHEDLKTMVRTSATPWTLDEMTGLTMRAAFHLARSALTERSEVRISQQLELVYVHRDTQGDPLGVSHFDMDSQLLQNYLDRVFLLLDGDRAPEGVGVQATRRCESCAWRDGCEWRETQARAVVAKAAEQYKQKKDTAHLAATADDALWNEFDIPEHHLCLLEW
ncbi:hypothetical protein MBRA1_001264 [Malassezia brasiliensis]|uniref:Exonuclease V n=1 Tax=Malassezia brasiliensis TaxID=1821822 RepID=A0AAF0DTR6_9BASI|nr:hypothetical protein MBRA1_001264 [Malassezia brasiliensis]